jgi:acetolactate synthase-1/2/3 large subunit
MQSTTTFSGHRHSRLPGYRPVTKPHGKQIREAARLIRGESRRPVLYVGGGVIKSGAVAQLRELAGSPSCRS